MTTERMNRRRAFTMLTGCEVPARSRARARRTAGTNGRALGRPTGRGRARNATTPVSKRLAWTQKTPLPERQVAKPNGTDAHAFQPADAQADKLAHAPDLSLSPFAQNEP